MTRCRRAGAILGMALVSLALTVCRAGRETDPPVSTERRLAEIREAIEQKQHREAWRMARALLESLDASGRSDAYEAAETIDLLLRAMWRADAGYFDPDAMALAKRALVIKEALGRVDDLSYAMSLNACGNMYRVAADLRQARPYFERVVRIRERLLDPNDPELARGLSNLAITSVDLGDYAASRPLMERVVSIMEKALGPDHPDVAVVRYNFSNTLRRLGDFEAARAQLDRAREIGEKRPPGPALGGVLIALGSVHRELGDAQGAERFYRRALKVYEEVRGQECDEIAWILGRLGALARDSGDADLALELIERGCEMRRRIDPEGVGLSECRIQLADVLADRGDLKRAADLYESALLKQEEAFGPADWRLAGGLIGHANLQWTLGLSGEALDGALRAEGLARAQFQEAVRGLSEREALRYEQMRAKGLNVALSVLAAVPPAQRRGESIIRVWDALVRSRSLVLDEMATRRRQPLVAQAPQMEALFSDLESARQRLARLAAGDPGPYDPEMQRQKIQQAQQEKEILERTLALESLEFRRHMARRLVGLADVVAALPGGTALVAYAQYGQPGELGVGKGVESYLALVAVDGWKEPAVVTLGEVSEIDASIKRWREVVTSAPRLLRASSGRDARDRIVGERVRRLIWDPLPEAARHSRQVFVVPDGTLHLVSLSALPDGHGGRLVGSGPLVHYLSAERDLSVPPRPRAGRGSALVVGGPDFGQTTARAPCAPGQTVSAASAVLPLRFDPIPSTLDEARDVAELWGSSARDGSEGVVTLVGEKATEGAFKRLAPGRAAIHVATHAFLVSDDGGAARARGAAPRAGGNPLLASGLAFAGAGVSRCADAAPEEDGVLLAEELAALDLSAADSVVLSACRTGIGTIQTGEGVLGLRRALEVAGAGTLVMSLWSVDDRATRQWMSGMYRARLEDASWPEAVRRATLEVIAARRAAGESSDPYYWGAFVAAGDWR